MKPLPNKQQPDSYSSPFSATIKQRRTGPTSLNTASSCKTKKKTLDSELRPRSEVAIEHSAARAYVGGLEGVGEVGDEHSGGAVSSARTAGGRVAFRGGFSVAAAALLPLAHRPRRGGNNGNWGFAVAMRRDELWGLLG